MMIGGTADGVDGSLHHEGMPTGSKAIAALGSLQNAGMWHQLTQEPGSTALAAALAVWICERAAAPTEHVETSRAGKPLSDEVI